MKQHINSGIKQHLNSFYIFVIIAGITFYFLQSYMFSLDSDRKNALATIGRLEEVNKGCFTGGECFVVVDGKHITTLVSGKSDVVGRVLGVEGFENLENLIGEEVEVYADNLSDGTSTLYGNDSFYIKLLDTVVVGTSLGKEVGVFWPMVTPLEVLEDSRCPVDVVCIHAGTVRVKTALESEQGASSQIFKLGEKVITEGREVTLVKVDPAPEAGKGRDKIDYLFYFQIKKQ